MHNTDREIRLFSKCLSNTNRVVGWPWCCRAGAGSRSILISIRNTFQRLVSALERA